jgi:hypothetical protein
VPVPSSPIPSATAVQYTVARLLECLSEFERWLGSPLLQMDFGVRSSKMKSGAV